MKRSSRRFSPTGLSRWVVPLALGLLVLLLIAVVGATLLSLFGILP